MVRFDVPGTGGSPTSLAPYGFPYLAWVLGRVLSKLGIGVVDVLGLSWGGALAQQFAFQNPRRCRRLVLVATGTGAIMVPAHPRILAKMVTPRRFSDPDYAASIAGELYGGTVRAHGEDVARLFVQQLHAGSKIGYLHQLLAGSVWTSLFALPAVRQQTLIVAGTDDPIIPVINARIMKRCCPIRGCTCIPAATSTSCTTPPNSRPSSTISQRSRESGHDKLHHSRDDLHTPRLPARSRHVAPRTPIRPPPPSSRTSALPAEPTTS